MVSQILILNKQYPIEFISEVQQVYIATFNFIAETKEGDQTNVIVVGSQLDTVINSPGVNDNGSGSSASLELAIEAVNYIVRPRNKLRFIWWSASEELLSGSNSYLNSLHEDDKNKIYTYINLDRLGSINGLIQISNGELVPENTDGNCIRESTLLSNVVYSYLASQGLPWTNLSMAGCLSDYYPFILNNITTIAFSTGTPSNTIKNDTQKNVFGGLSGAMYDPCYHLPCDNLSNLNQTLLLTMSQIAAHLIEIVAMNNLF